MKGLFTKKKDDKAKVEASKDAAKTDDKKAEGKRTMSVKNIFSFGRKNSTATETNGEGASAVENEEEILQYQSCTVPVNMFDLNDDNINKVIEQLQTSKLKTKIYKLPADTRSMLFCNGKQTHNF